jgi:hypothetical protein
MTSDSKPAPEEGRYAARGVSASKRDVHAVVDGLDRGLYPGAFCKLTEDILTGDPTRCNVTHADGAGTKSSLAYLYWKETGDLSVWRGIAQVLINNPLSLRPPLFTLAMSLALPAAL